MWLAGFQARAADLFSLHSTNAASRVVIVENTNAIVNFQPDENVLQTMVNLAVTNFTGKATAADAWRSLVSTQDVVGIKVFSAAGELSGTRPIVVAAVIHGLLDAGLPATNIRSEERRV